MPRALSQRHTRRPGVGAERRDPEVHGQTAHVYRHTQSTLTFFYSRTTLYLQGGPSSQLADAFRSNEIRVHK